MHNRDHKFVGLLVIEGNTEQSSKWVRIKDDQEKSPIPDQTNSLKLQNKSPSGYDQK